MFSKHSVNQCSPSGGQLFFLPVPRYASCLFGILTSFEDRWEKRPAPCLRFSGRTSGSPSKNATLLPWPSVRHDNCTLARSLRPKREMLSAVKGRRLFATNRRWRKKPKPSHVARSCTTVWPQKTWSQPDNNVQLRD